MLDAARTCVHSREAALNAGTESDAHLKKLQD